MPINDTLSKLLKQATQIAEGIETPVQKEIKRQYQIALEDILKDLQNFHNKYDHIILDKTIDSTRKLGLLSQHNRLNNIKLRILSILNERYKVTRTQTLKSIKDSLKEGYYSQGYAYYNAFKGAGVNINFGLFDPNVIEASVLNPKDKITGYILRNKSVDGKWIWDNSLKQNHAKAFQKIDQAITQGIIKGQGYSKTAREVSQQIFNTKERRFALQRSVETVIKTETQKARSLASLLSYDDVKNSADRLGVGVQRVWIHALQVKEPRQSHLALHNMPEDKNGQWNVNGTLTDAPNLTGNAEDDINCHCSTETRIEGLESKYDETKAAKTLNKENYEIWKKTQIKR